METFSFNPPIKFPEEGKPFFAVTYFDATISVYNIANENNVFSISTTRYWSPKSAEETINLLKELIKLTSRNDIELQFKEVKKRGSRMEIQNTAYNLAGSELFKKSSCRVKKSKI